MRKTMSVTLFVVALLLVAVPVGLANGNIGLETVTEFGDLEASTGFVMPDGEPMAQPELDGIQGSSWLRIVKDVYDFVKDLYETLTNPERIPPLR